METRIDHLQSTTKKEWLKDIPGGVEEHRGEPQQTKCPCVETSDRGQKGMGAHYERVPNPLRDYSAEDNDNYGALNLYITYKIHYTKAD